MKKSKKPKLPSEEMKPKTKGRRGHKICPLCDTSVGVRSLLCSQCQFPFPTNEILKDSILPFTVERLAQTFNDAQALVQKHGGTQKTIELLEKIQGMNVPRALRDLQQLTELGTPKSLQLLREIHAINIREVLIVLRIIRNWKEPVKRKSRAKIQSSPVE